MLYNGVKTTINTKQIIMETIITCLDCCKSYFRYPNVRKR